MNQKKKIPKGRKRKRGSSRIGSSKKSRPSSASTSASASASASSPAEEEKFGFVSGPDFTLEEFEKYARGFKNSYFERKGGDASPSIEEIEKEYWRIVEHAAHPEEVEVYYGADLEKKVLGSGFEDGEASGWNLNNLPRLSGSLLPFERKDISGVLVPWVYVGMCFSSFCWVKKDTYN